MVAKAAMSRFFLQPTIILKVITSMETLQFLHTEREACRCQRQESDVRKEETNVPSQLRSQPHEWWCSFGHDWNFIMSVV